MANHTYVKNLNERRVLTLLRVEGQLTRAEVARRLGLNRSTITNLVDGLLQRSLLTETDRVTNQADGRDMGRPGINIALNPSGCYFLGVEIGVDVLRFALLNMVLEVVEKAQVSIAPPHTPEKAAQHISVKLAKYLRDPRYSEKIQSVYVTAPGLVRNDGVVAYAPIAGWRDVDFLRLLESKLSLPVHLENDANAAAFGEVYCHPMFVQGLTVFFTLLANGCGGAVIINDRILKGSAGLGGDFGHIRVQNDGPICNCGQRGCLEPLVSLKALQEHLDEKAIPKDASPEEIVDCAVDGNASALAATKHFTHYLALGLISATNIFNPNNIILGGLMRPVIEFVLDDLREAVRTGIMPGIPAPSIELSRNGEYECAIGVAALAHQAEFDEATIGLA